MAGMTPPEVSAAFGVTIGALITQVGNWLINHRKRDAEARKVSAEGHRIEVESQATLADEWRKMVQELRREMERSDASCKALLADLQHQIDGLKEAQSVRDRIIIALVNRREMDAEARTLLLQIAPSAKPAPPSNGEAK